MVSWLFDIPPSTPLINTVLNFIHAGTFYLFTYRLLMGLFSLLITWFPFLPGFGQRIHMKLVRPNLQLFALQITIQKSFNHVTIYYHKISKSPPISKDLQNHVSLQEKWAIAADLLRQVQKLPLYVAYCGAFLTRCYAWDLLRRFLWPPL